MPADRIMRRIDMPAPVEGGVEVQESVSSPAGPKLASIPEPTDLVLSSALARSSQAPTAIISAEWSAPPGTAPNRYAVQWSTDPAFPPATTAGQDAPQQSIAITDVKTATTYYVRVAAAYKVAQSDWSDAASITTVNDTTPPPPPTGLTLSFSPQGALIADWTPGAGETMRDTEVRIYDSSSKTVLYQLAYVASNHYEWTAAQNRAATSGTPDPSLYVEVRSRSWGNIYSAAINASATKARPVTPVAVTPVWDAVAGTCTFAWSPVADAAAYLLTIDGVTRRVVDARLEYTVALNRLDHSGNADPSLTWSLIAIDALDQTSVTPATGTSTLPPPATPTGMISDFTGIDTVFTWNAQPQIVGFRIVIDTIAHDAPLSARYTYPFALNIAEHSISGPDPVLDWSLVAVDGLGQTSTAPLTGTAVNPPPDAAIALDVLAGFTALSFSAVVALEPLDLDVYVFRLYKDGVLYDTKAQAGRIFPYEPPERGSWNAGVIVRDLFGQESAEVFSPTNDVDPLRLADLRAEALYTDSDGKSQATLAVLKEPAGGNVYYGGAYAAHWTQMERPLTDRYKWVTLSAAPGGASTIEWFIGASLDGVAWEYFAGPFAADGLTLTSYGASDSNAYANRLTTMPSGGRVALPHIMEARFTKIVHLSGSDYTFHQFYARRYVQTDDLDAEFIRGMRISGHQFIADELAAISAALGSVTITGVCDIGSNGGIWQGAASGGGTFASPVNGLKIWRDATTGVGRIATYASGVIQVQFDTSGRLSAAAGAITLDATGLKTYNGSTVQCQVGTDGGLLAGAGSIKLDATGLNMLASVNQTSALTWRRSSNFGGGIAADINVDATLRSTMLINVGTYAAFGSNSSATIKVGYNSQASLAIVGDSNSIPGVNSAITLTAVKTYVTGDLATTGTASAATGSMGTLAVSGTSALNGSVNIGQTAAGADVRLSVKGGGTTSATYGFIVYTGSGANVINLSLRDDRVAYVAANAWSYGSDRRLKSRVLDLTPTNTKNNPGRGLREILSLRPRRFDYKHGAANNLGFVADELQEVIPELVNEGPEGMLSIQTTALIPILVNAIKELHVRLIALEGKQQ